MPTKKKEYVKFGTTKIRIPKKMVGFDKQNKPHIYKTITPKRKLSYHNKKAALDITVNNNTKTKINRVPNTTKLIKAIEQKKKRKPRQPRLPPAAGLAPPPPPPPFQPPRPPPPPPAPPRPDIRFQQPNMPIVNQFFQSPAPQLLQSPPAPLNPDTIQAAIRQKLARQQYNILQQRQQQMPYASVINLAIKSRLARKQADKIRKRQIYEQAIARVGNPIEMVNRQSPVATRLPYSDINEEKRIKKIAKIEKKQTEYKSGLNRRLSRDKAAAIIQRNYKSSQMFKEPKPAPSVILPTEIQPILSRKTPEEAAAIILKNIKTYKFNKRLKQNRNKKLQEKLLKETDKPSSSTDRRKQEEEQQRQMNILKKNFNDKRNKQDKEALKNQKDRQKEFPKSFKDQPTKDWYIKTISDEYEVYKSDTYKLYEQLQEVKNKPVNLRNQKKIYDLELEILLIGGEARFWKAEIKRAKDIKI